MKLSCTYHITRGVPKHTSFLDYFDGICYCKHYFEGFLVAVFVLFCLFLFNEGKVSILQRTTFSYLNCQHHIIQLTTPSLNTFPCSPGFPLVSSSQFLCESQLLSHISQHQSCCRSVIAHFIHQFYLRSSSPTDNATSTVINLRCTYLDLPHIYIYIYISLAASLTSLHGCHSHRKFISKTRFYLLKSPNPLNNYFHISINDNSIQPCQKYDTFSVMSEIGH